MRKFLDWFELNRQTIGFAVGGLNLLNGLLLLPSNLVLAIFWLLLGAVIIFDTYMYK